MTDDKRERIAHLSIIAYRAKQRYNALLMLNTNGLSEEDAERLEIEYNIARAEYYEAEAALNAVVGS